LGHNTIAKLERDELKIIQPWILGRILSVMQGRLREVFPDVRGDIYDYLIPPKTFGYWRCNFRVRRGLRQGELAKALGVNKYTITRYEANQSKPNNVVRRQLKEIYNLNSELDKFVES
jgi:DNA-binding XRE family transcriptional regulator